MSSELHRIERLSAIFGAPLPPGARLGIGDDAAVLDAGAGLLVWTVDAQVEGVHFTRSWVSLEDLGWRSLMAAASDLAAMAAAPRGVLASLVLPDAFTDAELDALAAGQASAARALGTAVLGGNLSRGGELSVTTTVLGQVARPLARSGARAGDVVLLGGAVGLARAGLLALSRGIDAPALAPALAAFRRPTARLDLGLAAGACATAAIDVSDGLALDASRLADASGVGVVLDRGALVAATGPRLADACAALGEDPVETALAGGEDYALVVTAPRGAVPAGFDVVGECVPGSGLALKDEQGNCRAVAARGFDHFG